jgi:hypothetical protein
MKKPVHYTHRTVEDYVNEFAMPPILQDTHEVVPINDLESYFFYALDRHHGHQLDHLWENDHYDEEPF